MNSPLNYLNQILELTLSQEHCFTTACANYCWSILPNQPCQLSLWDETGVPEENP